jgi:hypothetical protein
LPVDRGPVEVVDVVEVPEQGTRGEAGALGDLGGARFVVALAVELGEGVEHGAPVLLPPGPPAVHLGAHHRATVPIDTLCVTT